MPIKQARAFGEDSPVFTRGEFKGFEWVVTRMKRMTRGVGDGMTAIY
jgi:hypothetical protein